MKEKLILIDFLGELDFIVFNVLEEIGLNETFECDVVILDGEVFSAVVVNV